MNHNKFERKKVCDNMKNTSPTPVWKTGEVNPNDIKVFALGGLGVVGMNMYIVEIGDEIMIIDSGILFADNSHLGVDYIIPDYQYLIDNEHRIVGLFITHGHEDHIGGIPFLLKKVRIPKIYASGLAVGLIDNKLSEYKGLVANMVEYSPDSVYKFKHFEISFFRTNHSVPDSFGFAIKTRLGYIVHTGDFKFDFTPLGEPADYYKIAKLGHDGVLCLLSDSTNAEVAKFASSEKKISQTIKNIMFQIKGRVIIATFASNVYRVQQIVEACVAAGRKIIVFGRSMEKAIQVAERMKYINAPRGTFITARDMANVPAEKLTILSTGTQGEPLAALSRIADGTHKQIKLQPNDTIVFSSSAIPGNEQSINRTINRLYKAGADVIINSDLTDTHTTGHASQDELKLMLALTKPKYFIPIHGEYYMLKMHSDLAIDTGVDPKNIYILDSGDAAVFNEAGARVVHNYAPSEDTFIDSSLTGVDSSILKERKFLSDDGVVSLVFSINSLRQEVAPVSLVSKGFIYMKDSEKLITDIKYKATEVFNAELSKQKNLNIQSIKGKITSELTNFIYEKTERRPVIVPIILVV